MTNTRVRCAGACLLLMLARSGCVHVYAHPYDRPRLARGR